VDWSGVVDVAFAIDAFPRRIFGWKADTTIKTSLVLDTLEMALSARDHHGLPAGINSPTLGTVSLPGTA